MTTSRRAILGAVVAAGALTGAAAGTAIAQSAWPTPAITPVTIEPDPIFDLIERHLAAYAAHGVAVLATDAAIIGSADYVLAYQRQAAACRADYDALRALVLTVPSTFAGAAAMLRYLIEYEQLGNSLRPISDDLIGTMLKFAEART